MHAVIYSRIADRNSTLVLAVALLFFGLVASGTLAAGQWQHITEKDNPALPGDRIQFIESTDQNVIWIGGLRGLTRYEGGQFTAVKRAEGKPFNNSAWDVLALGGDRWMVGSSRGAALVKGAVVEEEFLGGQTVSPVLRGQGQTIWALGKKEVDRKQVNTVFEYEKGEWSPVKALAAKKVEDLCVSSAGHFWVSIAGDGVIEANPEADPEQWEHHLKGYNITTVGEDASGQIWCGLWERGVASYVGKAWDRHLSDEDTIPLKIASPQEGELWVATNDRGLFRYANAKWTQKLEGEGAINLLHATADGRVWVSSQQRGGLRYWDGKKWNVALPGPLPIRDIAEAPDGSVWAGGILDGLHILRR